MQQIDIHTHQLKKEEHIQILNIFAQDLPVVRQNHLFSAGIHPWHIETVKVDKCLQEIERATQLKNMIAIGECGLDRSVSTSFALQELYFRAQIQIAHTAVKPLIIHCVRAYSELLKLKKETRAEIPWIIHGFRGNQQTAQSLVRHGFFLSVGEQFLNDQSKQNALQTIPPEQLFLETDDRKISVGSVYQKAALALKIDEEELTEIIFNTFKKVFGNQQEEKTGNQPLPPFNTKH